MPPEHLNDWDWDVEVELDSGVLVWLVEGGDQVPWAIHEGKLWVGLPPEDHSLPWRVNRFWVLDSERPLSPEEYREAVLRAELHPSGMRGYFDPA